MRSEDVLRQAIDKVGVKSVAAALKLSTAQVYKWCQTHEEDRARRGAANPLERVATVLRITRDEDLIAWLCQQLDGFFVRNPALAREHEPNLLVATQHLVEAFSNLLGEVSRSTSDDNAVCQTEARRIRREWERLKSTAESFVVACERGDFRAGGWPTRPSAAEHKR